MNKEGPGGPTPDRKPCLKVTMHLPAIPNHRASPTNSSGGTGPKKAYQGVRDFDVTTLNPIWDTSFDIGLPIPKSMLKVIVDKFNYMELVSRGGCKCWWGKS